MKITTNHDTNIYEDDDGWFFAECSCGWQSFPMPGPIEAKDEADDHVDWHDV